MKIHRYIVFSIIIGFIIYSIISISSSKKEAIIERERYYKSGFNGILKKKVFNRGLRIYLENNGKINKQYLYSSKNYYYNPSDLYDFILVNDSVIKVPESLDLYIIRNKEKFYFKLGEYINK